jgi:hypothetical protein
MQDWLNNFRELADLNAQLSMASAAWWMLVVTVASVVVGAIGIIGLLWSIRETRAAVRAAMAANDLTSLAHEIEFRPWIKAGNYYIDTFAVTDIGTRTEIMFVGYYDIQNSGNVAAQIIGLQYELYFSLNGQRFRGTNSIFGNPHISIIPQDSTKIPFFCSSIIEVDDISRIKGAQLSFSTKITYKRHGSKSEYLTHSGLNFKKDDRRLTWNKLELGEIFVQTSDHRYEEAT